MITTRALLLAVITPGLIGLCLTLIAWRPWRQGKTPRGQWAAPLAIAGAYVVGINGLERFPSLPPSSAQDWLVWAAMVVGVVGLVDAIVKLPMAVRAGFVLAAGAGLSYLLVRPMVQDGWDRRDSVIWIGGIAIAMAVAFVFFELAATRAKGAAVPGALMVGASGLAAFTAFSGSQSSGQCAGIFAAVLGGVAVTALWSGRFTLARGGVLTIVLLLGGVASTCYAYLDEVNATRFLVVLAAPIIGCAVALLPVRPWLRAVLAVIVTAGVIAVPLVPTGRTFFRELNGSEESSQ